MNIYLVIYVKVKAKHARDIMKISNKLKNADLKEDYPRLKSALLFTFTFMEEIGKLYEQMSQQVLSIPMMDIGLDKQTGSDQSWKSDVGEICLPVCICNA